MCRVRPHLRVLGNRLRDVADAFVGLVVGVEDS
jgi:hypothetical protein